MEVNLQRKTQLNELISVLTVSLYKKAYTVLLQLANHYALLNFLSYRIYLFSFAKTELGTGNRAGSQTKERGKKNPVPNSSPEETIAKS